MDIEKLFADTIESEGNKNEIRLFEARPWIIGFISIFTKQMGGTLSLEKEILMLLYSQAKIIL